MRRSGFIVGVLAALGGCALVVDFDYSTGGGGSGGVPQTGGSGTGGAGGTAGTAGNDTGGGTPGPTWIATTGGDGSEVLLAMAVSPLGRAAIAGTFTGTLELGGETLSATEGRQGFFFAQYGTAGEVEWARKITEVDVGDANQPFAAAFQYDSADRLHAAGTFVGEATFDPASPMTATGFADVFLVKFDVGGNVVEQTHYGDGNSALAVGLARRPSDEHLFISGYYCGSLDFGCGPLNGACGDVFAGFLVELNKAGECERQINAGGGTGKTIFTSIDVGEDGSAALSGWVEKTLFSLGGGAQDIDATASRHLWAAKLGPGWGAISTIDFAGPGDIGDFVSARLDADGDGLVLSGAAQAVSPADPTAPGHGGLDFFVGRANDDGSSVKLAFFGGAGTDSGLITAAKKGGFVGVGTFQSRADFEALHVGPANSADGFIVHLDENLEPSSVDTVGGSGEQFVQALGLDDGANEIFAGTFSGELVLGDATRQSAGGTDIFVARKPPSQ